MTLDEFRQLQDLLRTLADLKARYPDRLEYKQSWEILNTLYEKHWSKFVGKL